MAAFFTICRRAMTGIGRPRAIAAITHGPRRIPIVAWRADVMTKPTPSADSDTAGKKIALSRAQRPASGDQPPLEAP